MAALPGSESRLLLARPKPRSTETVPAMARRYPGCPRRKRKRLLAASHPHPHGTQHANFDGRHIQLALVLPVQHRQHIQHARLVLGPCGLPDGGGSRHQHEKLCAQVARAIRVLPTAILIWPPALRAVSRFHHHRLFHGHSLQYLPMRWATFLAIASAAVVAHAASFPARQLQELSQLRQQPLIATSISPPSSRPSVNTTRGSVIAPETVPVDNWSVNAATCHDLSVLCGVKAENTATTPSCVCVVNASNNNAVAGTNDTSSQPAEVTAAGAIPQQFQSSMAGLLGFFIMCLVML
ncbi:hypothetical protein S40288_10639 [Stachybotrys chartarum IBT 40288]|nr:hypothetical protein S40288_10639 [Stachybotrys chartarum IBT 40288]